MALIFSALAVLATLAVAGLGTRPVTEWYQGLNKPSWQPEPSTIGIAWAIIYPLMAIASALVLIKSESVGRWWLFFGINLVVNAAWSWIFFVYQHPLAGSAFLALLVLSVGSLIIVAAQTWWLPALLLVPYLLWCCVAFAVNFTIARLN